MNTQSNHPNLSRRGFLATTASVAALSVLGSGCAKEERKSVTSMVKGKIPIGVQVYSVREVAQKDLAGTIAKIAQMGYQGVEFAGYYGHSAKDIRKMMDDNKIVCCGTHTQYADLADDKLAATLEFNKTLGNKYVIVPWLEGDKNNPKDSWLKYAQRFNVLAEKLKKQGMFIGYHAHAHDVHPLGDTTSWDIFFSNTTKDVIMQVDTGNVMSGGGDPIAFLKKYPGRAVTVHLKEHSATNPKAMIGEGDVKWTEVFRLCRSIGGTQWYIVEEEKDATSMTGIQVSLNNLKKFRM
ncbi:MAG TPA: TIM barrel protein [Sedimentisphaerales bacterium]|jgi:sugar phosphate isomerase/epimerase|nr:TIM barrel protein [Sedimentisphaerales bacterium]HNU29407.1 TIM barrel protein [Sedimentisphaerales bacterium]